MRPGKIAVPPPPRVADLVDPRCVGQEIDGDAQVQRPGRRVGRVQVEGRVGRRTIERLATGEGHAAVLIYLCVCTFSQEKENRTRILTNETRPGRCFHVRQLPLVIRSRPAPAALC